MSAVLDRNCRPMRLAASANTTPLADAAAKRLRVCNCGNDAVGIAGYMVTEMQRNPFSEAGKKITEANAYDIGKEMQAWNALPWYGRIGGPPDYAGIALGRKTAAYTLWARQVGPGQPWDHKPILAARLRAQNIFRRGWQRYGSEDYFYDIWSNIHYGYVGAACGFGLDELLGGAGLAQAGSDIARDLARRRFPSVQHHPQNGAWANTLDDIPDHISIKLGANLYRQAGPAALTVALLLKAIVSVPIPWGVADDIAKRPHQCPQ